MIRLTKSEKPPVLVQNDASWNLDYVSLRAEGRSDKTIESRHRHAQIKSALIAETSDKCAYCEEKLSSAQFGDVEHILPKRAHPHLYAEWTNLTLACEQCNNAKSDREGFVHPYEDEPSDFLSFAGPLVRYKPGDERGQLTVRGLKLNRTALLAKRATALERLVEKLDLFEVTPPGPLREVIQQEIEAANEDQQEFAATIRAFLRA